jgi:hypothetical protein
LHGQIKVITQTEGSYYVNENVIPNAYEPKEESPTHPPFFDRTLN